MITEEKFVKVLDKVLQTQKYFHNVEEILKFDVFESPVYENTYFFFDSWLEIVVKEEFIDTVNAYLWPEDDFNLNGYDRSEEHPLKIFYKDGAVNEIGTLKQLYTYLKENDGLCTNC